MWPVRTPGPEQGHPHGTRQGVCEPPLLCVLLPEESWKWSQQPDTPRGCVCTCPNTSQEFTGSGADRVFGLTGGLHAEPRVFSRPQCTQVCSLRLRLPCCPANRFINTISLDSVYLPSNTHIDSRMGKLFLKTHSAFSVLIQSSTETYSEL